LLKCELAGFFLRGLKDLGAALKLAGIYVLKTYAGFILSV